VVDAEQWEAHPEKCTTLYSFLMAHQRRFCAIKVYTKAANEMNKIGMYQMFDSYSLWYRIMVGIAYSYSAE